MVDIVSVSYPPVSLIPRSMVDLPGETVGYPAQPRLICLSFCKISFNYSAENLLIPTIKATNETSWYHIDSTPVGYPASTIIANILFRE